MQQVQRAVPVQVYYWKRGMATPRVRILARINPERMRARVCTEAPD